jgi:hypothetical protein
VSGPFALGVLAGLGLGALHLYLFWRGVALLLPRSDGAAAALSRILWVFLAGGRYMLTACLAGFCAMAWNLPPAGLGVGLVTAFLVGRVGLWARGGPPRDLSALEGKAC